MKRVTLLLKAVLAAYVVTAIFLLLLALLLYKVGIGENVLKLGMIGGYVLSTCAGGFVAGMLMKEKCFAWGLLLGLVYYLLLLLISFAVFHSFAEGAGGMITAFALCAGGGMLGGMLAGMRS